MRASLPRPRLALIGISGYGRIHLQLARACRDRGEADLVAAVVINPAEETANVAELRARGCEVFADYEEMLRCHAGRIDLCLIPTGIHWHAPMTIAALRAGANVLVEKPLAGSLEEVVAIQETERASRRFVAVGFQDCYDPGTHWLVEELRRGVIGEIRAVRFLGVWPRPRAYFARNDWAGRLRVDGRAVLDSPLNNAFAHFVMLSLIFAGADRESGDPRFCGVELFRCHAIESFDTAVVRLRTPRDVGLWFGVSHTSREALEPDIVVEGAEGTACWSYEKEAWIRDTGGHRWRRPIVDQHGARSLMMAAVLRRLDDPATPICSSRMAALHTRVIEGIHHAAPVVTIPERLVDWVGPNGPARAIPEVTDLVPSLRRAFAERGLLRDSGFVLAPGENGS